MAPSKNQVTKQTPLGAADDAKSNDQSHDVAQAYRDLARGEQAAAALESNLAKLESKLDAMLDSLIDKQPPDPIVTPEAKDASDEPSK